MVDYVSDELLAAYIEGNVSLDEAAFVQSQQSLDSSIAETVDIFDDFKFGVFPDSEITLFDANLHLGHGYNELSDYECVTDDSGLLAQMDDLLNYDMDAVVDSPMEDLHQSTDYNFDDNSINYF